MSKPLVTLEAPDSPEARLRRHRAEALADFMETQGISRKELRRRLAERGVAVSLQAIGQWLRGETSPRPHVQGHVAAVLNAPAHRVFPVEAA